MWDHAITVGDLVLVAGWGIAVVVGAVLAIFIISLIGKNEGWFRW